MKASEIKARRYYRMKPRREDDSGEIVRAVRRQNGDAGVLGGSDWWTVTFAGAGTLCVHSDDIAEPSTLEAFRGAA